MAPSRGGGRNSAFYSLLLFFVLRCVREKKKETKIRSSLSLSLFRSKERTREDCLRRKKFFRSPSLSCCSLSSRSAMPAKASEWKTVTKPSSRRTKQQQANKETSAEVIPATTAADAPPSPSQQQPVSPATPDASTNLKNLLGVVPLEQQQHTKQQEQREEAVARVSTPPTAEEKKAEVKAKQQKQQQQQKDKAPSKAPPKRTPAPEAASASSSSAAAAPSYSSGPSVRADPVPLCVAQVRFEQDERAEWSGNEGRV